MSELPRIIQALRRRHPRNNFRRRRFCILLIEPRLHLAGGALDLNRRQIFVWITHRRGFSGAAGMYGELTPAPNGLIDRRPGGIS